MSSSFLHDYSLYNFFPAQLGGNSHLTILLFFLLVHFLYGVVAPYGRGRRLLLWGLMERAAAEIGRRLNRPMRSNAERGARGFAATLAMAVFSLVIGAAVTRLESYHYGWVADVVFLSFCISVMRPLKQMRAVWRALAVHKLKEAIDILQPCTDEDLSKADRHAVLRHAIAALAEGLNRQLVAPACFFLCAGAPGISFYVTMVALDSALRPNGPEVLFFAAIPRGMERILNYIPARLTGVLICLGSLFVGGANPALAVRGYLTQARYYVQGSAGCTIAAMAGALGVTLGGRVRYLNNRIAENKWVGPHGSSAKATEHDLKSAAMLSFIVFLCLFVLVSIAVMTKEKYS